MFPNLNYLTPEQFGEERSAALIGAQMAVANTAIVVSPLFFGFLGQALGMGLFRILPVVLLCFLDNRGYTKQKTVQVFFRKCYIMCSIKIKNFIVRM